MHPINQTPIKGSVHMERRDYGINLNVMNVHEGQAGSLPHKREGKGLIFSGRKRRGAFVLWIPQLGLFCLSCVPSKPSYVPVMRKNVKSLGVMGQVSLLFLKALAQLPLTHSECCQDGI